MSILGYEVDERMSARARAKFLPESEAHLVGGAQITDVCRRGKFIVILTNRGAILSHNAMSGYWDAADSPWTFDYVEGQRTATDSDVRVTLYVADSLISDDQKSLRYHDARMFGSLHAVTPEQLAEKLSELGPDAINTLHLYEPRCFLTSCRSLEEALDTKKSLKEALTDQGRVAGIGNIYAVEALWAAGLSPLREARSLTHDELDGLFCSVRSVLEQALERKLDYDGLKVYRRKSCARCEAPIRADKVKGRTTYWCSRCQH